MEPKNVILKSCIFLVWPVNLNCNDFNQNAKFVPLTSAIEIWSHHKKDTASVNTHKNHAFSQIHC